MNAFEAVLVTLVQLGMVLAIGLLMAWLSAGATDERREGLRSFVGHLLDGQLRIGSRLAAFTRRGYVHRVVGKLPSGRDVRVTDRGGRLDYEVRVPGWTRDLTVTDAIARAEGAQASAQARAATLALKELLGLLSCSEVILEGGWLRVRRESFESAYSPESLLRVLGCMETLAELYAAIPFDIRLRGRVTVGWTAGGDAVRCPYCHDALDTAQEGLDACAACGTVHHGECLAEAGGCTVLGCVGRAQLRREGV